MSNIDDLAQKLVELVRSELPDQLPAEERTALIGELLGKTREKFDQLLPPAILEIGKLKAGRRFPATAAGANAGQFTGFEWTVWTSNSGPQLPQTLLDLDSSMTRNREVAYAHLPFSNEGAVLWHVWFPKSLGRPFESDAYLVTVTGSDGTYRDHILDWSSEPIYQLFKDQHFQTSRAPQAYLRLFLQLVRGKEGRSVFTLIEDEVDFRLRLSWLDSAANIEYWCKIARPFIKRIIRRHIVADGSLSFAATIVYSDSLYTCEFLINRDGLVLMEGEDLRLRELPVHKDW